MREKSLGYRIFTIFNYVLLGILALACLYPFFYVVVASISEPEALMTHNGLLFGPLGKITFDGYKMVFSNKLVLSGFRNTFIILFIGLLFNMTLTTLGAYVLHFQN